MKNYPAFAHDTRRIGAIALRPLKQRLQRKPGTNSPYERGQLGEQVRTAAFPERGFRCWTGGRDYCPFFGSFFPLFSFTGTYSVGVLAC